MGWMGRGVVWAIFGGVTVAASSCGEPPASSNGASGANAGTDQSTGGTSGRTGSVGGTAGRGSGGTGGASGSGGAGAHGGSAGRGPMPGGEGGKPEPVAGEGGASGESTSGAGGERPAHEGIFTHRPIATTCELPIRDSEIPNLPPDAGIEDLAACEEDWGDTCKLTNDCTLDADCGASSYCVRDTRIVFGSENSNEFEIHHRCISACETDRDCRPDQACVCSGFARNSTRTGVVFGVCVEASCRSDADCAGGQRCAAPSNPLKDWDLFPVVGPFHCQTPMDECAGPEDCTIDRVSEYCPKTFCLYETDRFACSTQDTCDG